MADVVTVAVHAQKIDPHPDRPTRVLAWCVTRAVFAREIGLGDPLAAATIKYLTDRTLQEIVC